MKTLWHLGIAFRGHCIPSSSARTSYCSATSTSRSGHHTCEKKERDDTHKDFRVRRKRVEGALCWLKDNNPVYTDIVIDEARLQNLPADGELSNLRTVEFSETTEHMDDQGPAPKQLDAGETDSSDDSTVSGVFFLSQA